MATDVTLPGSAGPGEVAIVFTLEREAAPFRRVNPGARIIISGVGRSKARFATQIAIEGFQPKLVIAAGFCGALTPHLVVGDVVTSPRIVTVNELVATPEAKRRLADRTGAEAVDMESAEVAAVCAEHGVPFLAVRAVSDDVETALSPELVQLLSGGRVSPWKATWALMQRPSLLGEFRRLARDTKIAGRKLAEALVAIVNPPPHSPASAAPPSPS
jgi:adenosylhomocysteine nucleosidase